MKRLLDVVASLAGLVLTLPVLAAAMLAVRVSLGSPVLFRQPRPGLHGRPFTLVKLRTMLPGPEADGEEARIPPLGRLLRRTSIDEIPQLWNVLVGDMSLVGPRPLLMEYLPLYSAEQARRHDVRPGLTGWAQVNGRNATSWEERFALDLWYVDHHSFTLDLRILARTVGQVLGGHGVTGEGERLMPRFTGSGHGRSEA